MSTLYLDLDPATDSRLNKAASATGRTPAQLVQEALEAYLEDLEDAREAEAVLARLERGEEATITLDELEKQLGLNR